MNKVILMGRLTKDPELRSTKSQMNVCTFTLAVDRRFKSANGERETDFIRCTAWRQQAEFVARYFRKGSRMALVGSLQTRTWDDNDGKRHYDFEVVAEEVHFADSKRDEGGEYRAEKSAPDRREQDYNVQGEGFMPGPGDDTSLPFDL